MTIFQRHIEGFELVFGTYGHHDPLEGLLYTLEGGCFHWPYALDTRTFYTGVQISFRNNYGHVIVEGKPVGFRNYITDLTAS